VINKNANPIIAAMLIPEKIIFGSGSIFESPFLLCYDAKEDWKGWQQCYENGRADYDVGPESAAGFAASHKSGEP